MSINRSGFVLDHTSGSNIQDTYEFTSASIGEGSYGTVRKGRHLKTDQVRAIKMVSKDKLKFLPKFRQEIQIMKELDHPNIVRLYETFEDEQYIYLVMELCEGGELFDRIISAGSFSERATAVAVKQMLSAVLYLHKHGVCHRDLKPENFLLLSSSLDSPLKLIDFGLSARFSKEKPTMSTKSGTPYYVAPEVLGGQYNEKCDVWSIGVLTYVLLCGYPPFNGPSDKDILARVKAGRYAFPDTEWNGVSMDGKNFVRSLLELYPLKRASAEQALEHAWLKAATPTEPVASAEVRAGILGSLRAFRGISKLKRIALTAIAHQLQDSEISELKNTFIALDIDADGTLTISEIRAALDRAGIVLPPDFLELVSEVDSDGSGSVDYMEFIAATLDQKLYHQRDVCWRAFRMFDRDGDGKISVGELAKVLQEDEVQHAVGRIADMVAEFDLNKDGEIDFDEFMAMMRTSPQNLQ